MPALRTRGRDVVLPVLRLVRIRKERLSRESTQPHAFRPKRDWTPRLHCPTLIGPTDRLWLTLSAEAQAAGVDLNAGEAAFWLTHDHDDDAL